MSELVTVRASSLSGWPDCPRRAAARIFRKEIEAAGYTLRELPRGIGATVGTAIHAAAALTLKEKAATGNLAPLDAVTDCAVESFREQAAEGIEFDRETPEAPTAERQVVRMAKSYQAEVAPRIEPVLIEERLEADIGNGLLLSGQSDVIAREQKAISDLKTGTRLPWAKPQVGSYSLLARTAGVEIERGNIDFVPRVAVKKEQPPAQRVEYDIAECESTAANILDAIAAALKVWREGDGHRRLPGDPAAFLANPSSMLCSARWCAAWGTDFCHEHAIKENE